MTIFGKILKWVADICRVWAGEMRAIFKDEGVLIFFFLVPLAYPLLYSWIYNNEVVRETPVAVVDMSHSSDSRDLIRRCDATPDVCVTHYSNSLAGAEKPSDQIDLYHLTPPSGRSCPAGDQWPPLHTQYGKNAIF